jgi:hypothetical protein
MARNTMSDHFQKEIAFLGIENTPGFVRAPEGNGCAERFIRTLKENLLWIKTFGTIEDLRQALLAFRETLQHDLADRTARLHDADSLSPAAASARRQGGVGFKPVSQRQGAVQSDRLLSGAERRKIACPAAGVPPSSSHVRRHRS